MKNFKKRFLACVSALALAALLPISALATTVPTTGANSAVATNTSTSTIKVKTGNTGDNISLYKAVNITINSSNELEYEFTDTFKAFMAASTNYKTFTTADLVEYEADSTALKTVLGEFSAYVKTQNVTADYTGTTDSTGFATFANVPLGQYIVLGDGNTKNAKIYQVNTATVAPYVSNNVFYLYDNYTVEMKTSDPEISKTASTTAGTVGSKITFTISATVPTFPEGATNTTFFIKDTPSTGLTIDLDSITVANRDGTAYNTDAYTISYENGSLYVDFKYEKIKGNVRVVVTYDAILNERAVIGSAGNSNDATLVYANDPYTGSTYDPSGDDPRPDDQNGYGSVTNSEKIYTYGIVIDKFDKNKHETKLANAKFGIYDNESCTGTPIATITTDSNGYAAFVGLHSGTYYLKEIEAPAGYKLLTTVRTVSVTENSGTESFTKTTTVTYTSVKDDSLYKVQATDASGNLLWLTAAGETTPVAADTATATTNNYLKAYVKTVTTTVTAAESTADGASNYTLVEVENAEGKNLPGTGGMGVVPFIVVGSVLMIGAAVLLVTRKRMNDMQ